ncbi:MAG: macro domain-containing protein [Bacillota bacterium]
MINYYEGTVFNTSAKTIVNTINCVGVMGAGIALEFKLRFPEMYKDYKEKCNKNLVSIGRPYIYSYNGNLWILNFPTKKHWKNKSKLKWIELGLEYFRKNYDNVEIESVAFPKLGTNNGGLKWNDVKNLMEQYLSDLNIDIYICLNEKDEAEGVEKEMIDLINKVNYKNLIKEVGLSSKQAKTIIKNKPIKRFWHIKEFNGIGKKSYKKVFRYYYQLIKKKNKKSTQMAFKM